MPKQVYVDWNVVQRDRDAGVSVVDLVKKYGVANATIYHNTNTPKGDAPFRKLARPFKARAAAASPNGHGGDFDVAAAIAALKAKREKIDRSIAALEELL